MLSGNLKHGVSLELGPQPILTAAEAYRGSWTDLDRGVTVTADEMFSTRAALERQLRGIGLGSGERVVLAVGNGPAFPTALVALLALECCPLVLHARTPPAELRRSAQGIGARYVITDHCAPDELGHEFAATRLVAVAPWLEACCAEVAIQEPHAGQALDLRGVPLHPTSGTTGVPKIALRPGFAALEEARHYIETIGIDARDTILAVSPMSHAYAYGMAVMVPLASGASVVSMQSFGAKAVFQALAQHPITVLPAVPAMLDVLLFGAGSRLQDRHRRVLTAGSPLAERTATRFRETAQAAARPLYGTTETGGISVATADEALRVGCVGRPMAGVEVSLAPAESPVSEGRVGRLRVRSSSMMSGYLGARQIDTSALDDGWFTTGDLAEIDADGAIHLRGRESEVINVAGMKVLPLDVEEVLAHIPGMVEVKVYAGSTRSGSQYVKAAIVAEREISDQELRAYCERHLVYYKRPDRVVRLASLPRSPAGKILRDQLP